MTESESYQIRRLSRSVYRLEEFYRIKAPEVIKRAELMILREICDTLEINMTDVVKEPVLEQENSMAEEKKLEAPKVEPPATVLKSDYDKLVKEYQRLSLAFNKAMTIIANTYADKVATAIFEEIDKSAQQQLYNIVQVYESA